MSHKISHTLYGCVDWNNGKNLFIKAASIVTPCMGVWIETNKAQKASYEAMSHPVWVCGLKLFGQCQKEMGFGHTLYGCVDWNLVIANIKLM